MTEAGSIAVPTPAATRPMAVERCSNSDLKEAELIMVSGLSRNRALLDYQLARNRISLNGTYYLRRRYLSSGDRQRRLPENHCCWTGGTSAHDRPVCKA